MLMINYLPVNMKTKHTISNKKFNTNLFFIFLISLYLGNLSAQDMSFLEGMDQDAKDLLLGGSIASGNTTKSEYGNFTKNAYSNVLRSIDTLDRTQEEEAFAAELSEKRIDLAIRLCQQDEKACYLVENYKNYKNSEKINSVYLTPDELDLFGTDLFSGYPLSFEQNETYGPHSEYIIRPGDILEISIFGSSNLESEVSVNSDGSILIDKLGNLEIAGNTLKEARAILKQYVSQKIIGSDSSLNIRGFGSIQIYGLGNLSNPGLYELSSASKSINAIIASGGFKNNSSLRNINIVRDGKKIQSVDLYKFLIDGDVTADSQLINGDSVVVKAAENFITIFGEVNRPAKYEIKPGETILDILKFSLGFTEFANNEVLTVKRKNELGQFETLSLKVSSNFDLQHGDLIEVNALQGNELNDIKLFGELRNAGTFQYQNNLSLGDLITLETDLLDSSYVGFIAIKRFNNLTRSWSMTSLDLLDQDRLNNFLLTARDRIYVFSKQDVEIVNSSILQDFLRDILEPANYNIDSQKVRNLFVEKNTEIFEGTDEQIETQDFSCFNSFLLFGGKKFLNNSLYKLNAFNLNNVQCSAFLVKHPELTPVLMNNAIPVFGDFRKEGLYPVSKNVSVENLINISGGLLNAKSQSKVKIEVGSYIPESNTKPLMTRDNLSSLHASFPKDASALQTVELVGEFAYPGIYEINNDTTLGDIYKIAGGLSSQAYPEAAIFTRRSVADKETMAIKRAQRELSDILGSGVISGVIKQSSSDLIPLLQLLTDIDNAQPSGRLIADLTPRSINKDPAVDIFLEPGDVIYMPRRTNTITIVGSVLNSVTVPYNPKYSIKDYINQAGGYQDYADESRTYITLPSGRSVIPSAALFSFSQQAILPGSTITVPRNQRPLEGFSLVEAITPVLANLSITAASIASINR
jgi:protein involved in polysaccharide export with SLBB domain